MDCIRWIARAAYWPAHCCDTQKMSTRRLQILARELRIFLLQDSPPKTLFGRGNLDFVQNFLFYSLANKRPFKDYRLRSICEREQRTYRAPIVFVVGQRAAAGIR